MAKFWGACNELKTELDRCFREEKVAKRRANLEESKKFKEKLQAYKEKAAVSGLPSWTQMNSQEIPKASPSAS